MAGGVIDVVVIGGGPAGLVAAHRLMKLGRDVRVVEKAPRAGGHVQTIHRDGWRHEWGPNSLVASAHAVFELAAELGVTAVPAREAAKKRYLFLDGRLQPIPLNPAEILRSHLLPASAKLRLLKEPFQPRPRGDETVRAFFEERLGREFTERFVDAFVSGVYAGSIDALGMAAAFPRLMQQVQAHGSLAKAAMAMLRNRGEGPARKGTWSLEGGLGSLSEALAKTLGNRLITGTEATLRREGDEWRVGDLRASAVIVAAPAWASADIVRGVDPELGVELAALPYNPIAAVHLLYRASSLPRPLDGFGFLVPRREKVRTLGTLWPSAMFDTCAPGFATLTSMLGGAHDAAVLELDDRALGLQARGDLERTMGIVEAPVDVSLARIPKAIPSYPVGHPAWRERVRTRASRHPNLFLAGNWLEGVSLGDTAALSERIAREVDAALGGKERAA